MRLPGDGAHVVLADSADGTDAAAALCIRRTCETDVQRAIDDLSAQGITADLLFNNAGHQGDFGNVVDCDVTVFRRVLEINATGVFVVMKWFARTLVATSRPGATVDSASTAHGGAPNMVAYGASKAVVALTRTATEDLAHASIRVNAVSPAFIGPGRMWDRQVELRAGTPSQRFSDRPDEVSAQMTASVRASALRLARRSRGRGAVPPVG